MEKKVDYKKTYKKYIKITPSHETRGKIEPSVLTVHSKNISQVAQIKKALVRLVAGVGFEPTTFRL